MKDAKSVGVEMDAVGRGKAKAAAPQPPRREFALRFDALYDAAGRPPLRLLAGAARKRAHVVHGSARPVSLSAQRVSDWKTGRNVPSRFEVLLPVLLVLIDAARRRGRPSRADLVNLRLWKQLWLRARADRATATSTVERCPFRAAAPYSRQDALGFAGRDNAGDHLAALVRTAAAARGPERIVALYGASGVGKTSLLQAGVIPLLESPQAQRWSIRTVVFAADPRATLLELLGTVAAREDRPRLVIIDQFERFFAVTVDRTVREDLLRVLGRLAETAVVLLSLRAGCLARCGEHPLLIDAVQQRGYLLEPMRADQLRTVVTHSAYRHGITLEPGLDELLLTAIGGSRPWRAPGELSVLSRTLHAMWSARTGTRLTAGDYRKIGGVERVLHDAASALWEQLAPGERELARRILLDLVSVRHDADDTRRRVHHDESCCFAARGQLGITVAGKLIDAGLITVDVDDAYLSHDLLLSWRVLADWLDRDRSALLIRRQVAADAADWLANSRHPSLLYRGLRLSMAMNYADDVDDIVLSFLRESASADDMHSSAAAS